MKEVVSFSISKEVINLLKGEAKDLGISISSLVEKKLTNTSPPSSNIEQIIKDTVYEVLHVQAGGLREVKEEVIEIPKPSSFNKPWEK